MIYNIYMINPERDENHALFNGTHYLNRRGLQVDAASYDAFGPFEDEITGEDVLDDDEICEQIYIRRQYIFGRRDGESLRSVSVSDILELDPDTNPRFYMCDSRGWARLYDFTPFRGGQSND